MAEPGLSVEERELILGMLAHDIRQPIFLIRTHAQMGLNAAEKMEVQKHLIKITEATRRMERLVVDLLSYAEKTTKPKLLLRREETSVSGLVHQLLDELQVAYPYVRVQLNLTGDGVGFWDRERLHQILANLIYNAIQHGDMAEPIVIRSYPLDDGETHCIEVANSGETIPEEQVGKIFHPFQSGKAGNTGLGLYITKFLVEMHGGTISIDSNHGKTITFSVCLPIRPK